VILRLVRRPYGLHAIGPQDHAIIHTHAGPMARIATPNLPYRRHAIWVDREKSSMVSIQRSTSSCVGSKG
jgi:hypothetical protein